MKVRLIALTLLGIFGLLGCGSPGGVGDVTYEKGYQENKTGKGPRAGGGSSAATGDPAAARGAAPSSN